jgi:hypothetical protein
MMKSEIAAAATAPKSHEQTASLPKLVLCMRWGTRYGPEYVNRLFAGVRRHTTGPLQFICFTDDPNGVVEQVDCRPLPPVFDLPVYLANYPWRKLSLWARDLGDDLIGRTALFLDLDLVIVGGLDPFWDHAPGRFAVFENASKPGKDIGNTSVFSFVVGSHPELFERFLADPIGVSEREFLIEQEYISARLGCGRATQAALRRDVAADPFYRGLNEQVFFPKGWCVSFKVDLMPIWPLRLWREVALPETARIVVFHGKPDPDEAMIGAWPESKRWKRLYKRLRPVTWLHEHWR